MIIPTLINNPTGVDAASIRKMIDCGERPKIQFSEPSYSVELLRSVNGICRQFGDEIDVRFYGHDAAPFNANVLSFIPDVQSLFVDCIWEIANEQAIAALRCLRRLSFGVHIFDQPRFLEKLNVGQLQWLSLGENAKRNFDLSTLASAQQLRTLFLGGHTKNIDTIGTLRGLTELTLGSIPKSQELAFLSHIGSLRSLTIILGSRSSIDEISHPCLEELRILRVRGLESIGSLVRFPCLRNLEVEDQIQIRSVNLAGAQLERVVLSNCKNMEAIGGLSDLADLIEFRISRTAVELQALVDRDWPRSLQVLALFSGSQKWNDVTRAILAARGYRQFPAVD